MLMLNRRDKYPRVKVCWGLYKGRRQPKDDSIYREVQKAMGEPHIPRHHSSGKATLVEIEEEKKTRNC